MSFRAPSLAAFIAAWSDSFVSGFSVSKVRSTRLTSIVGTRTDWPSSLPLSAGITSASALAAPVDEGIMFIAAARARRRSPLRCGMSRTAWSFVYEWIVFMRPRLIPNVSFRTFATGARQFVVHEPHEMTSCFAPS